MKYDSPKLLTHIGGYETIRYNLDGNPVNIKHHRLICVAEYGFGAVRDRHVHHKNGFTWDNRVSNLEILDASDHGRIHNPDGTEKDHGRKLSWLDEIRICEIYEHGDCYQKDLGGMFGVTQRTISDIVNATGCSLMSRA